MKRYVKDLKIVKKRRLNADHFILELTHSEPLPHMKAGQFVQAKVENSPQTYLRRPLSVHDYDKENNRLKLMVQILGQGTTQLSYLEEGDYLNLLLPLGNSFELSSEGPVLLVGGGCGVAPLLLLARQFSDMGIRPGILIGARTENLLMELGEYEKYGRVACCTEDGSAGTKGYVTEHGWLKEEASNYRMIYSCGPEAMMRAVGKAAKQAGTPCQVSLENLMACGIGACLCCVAETHKGHVCSCTEGPVFNTKELKTW